MADASYVQDNFQAGEWSPSRQGRFQDPRYKAALAECLNYIPTMEGSLWPRSGFRRLGISSQASLSKLLPFSFSSGEPYVSETDGSFFTRVWANGLLLIQDSLGIASVSTGGTPTFTMTANFPAFWSTLSSPSVKIHFTNKAGLQAAPFLANRECIVNITGANTCTLSDAQDGSPITTPVGATFVGRMDLIFQVRSPLTNENLDTLRMLEFTSQRLLNDGQLATAPDHRAAIVTPYFQPWAFSSLRGVLDGPRYEQFIDGPYLDSTSLTDKATVSATTGAITVKLYVWDATVTYNIGSIAVNSSGVGFTSLINANLNNALPANTDAHWAELPQVWNSGTTYSIGQKVYSIGFNTIPNVYHEPEVFYSLQNSNTNKDPDHQPSFWSRTPPTYAAGTTYGLGDTVLYTASANDNGKSYVSIQAGNVGHTPSSSPTFWMPVDFQAALNIPFFTTIDCADTAVSSSVAYGQAGRVFRLKVGPQPWSNLTTYSTGDLVNFNDIIFKSLTNTNLNHEPDTDAVNWQVQTTTIQWTWGYLQTFTNEYTAVLTLKGADLSSSNPIWEWRFGRYCDRSGWPGKAAYHEGLVVLAGLDPNVIVMGQPDQGFSFSPTAPDGTVSDGNGITMTLNGGENEHIQALETTVDGIACFTDVGEWIIAASNLNDPITPTSVQAKRGTTFTGAEVQTATLNSSHAFVQGNRRHLLEYKSFIDVSAYQVRPNAADLTRDCQHLTQNGICEIGFQRIPQPVIWVTTGRLSPYTPVCNPTDTTFFQRKIFGIGFARDPDNQYVAPFSIEHGTEFVNGTSRDWRYFAVQNGEYDTQQYLYTMAFDDPALETNRGYIEMLEPAVDTSGFDDSRMTFYNDGAHGGVTLTTTQRIIAASCFLDAAVSPVGYKEDADFTGVTFYGIWPHRGNTVSFVIMGKYIGDFAVALDGSVHVPFSKGASTTALPNGDFSTFDLGMAAALKNADLFNTLPFNYQEFLADDNGDPFGTGITSGVNFYGAYFGYKYRRRCKTLRPLIGSQNGPTFAKTVRNARMGVYVNAAHEVSIGGSFANLVPLALTVDGPRNVTVLAADGLTTGIFRDHVKADYDYDGQLCLEQTEPYPGGILAVGGFDNVVDV